MIRNRTQRVAPFKEIIFIRVQENKLFLAGLSKNPPAHLTRFLTATN
jgi:hypothetical protein